MSKTAASPYRPFSADTYDSTSNALQRRVNDCAEAILAVMQPGVEWTCAHCDATVPRDGYVRADLVREAAERRHREQGKRIYESATYSLGISALVNQGLLRHGPGKHDWKLALTKKGTLR